MKSAKGNLALRIWVSSLYNCWTEILKRDLKFDGKNGISGRKRFIELSYCTLSIIHPEVGYDMVENSVTTFLRKQ